MLAAQASITGKKAKTNGINVNDEVNIDNILRATTETAMVVDLSPALARWLIGLNVNNRPVRPRYVGTLARTMFRGEWELNGDAIRISTTGRLLDGQHRCYAVIEAGVTIRTILVAGLPDSVFSTIDRGQARTTGDAMSIMGVVNSRAVASITRLLFIYERCGDPFNGNPDNHPTTVQQIELLNKNPFVSESASYASSSKWCKKYLTPSIAGFCHYVFFSHDAHAAELFFMELETGAGLLDGSPVLLLRERLVSSSSGADRITPSYKAALVFKAFKLFRDGARIKYLRVRLEGPMAEKDLFVL